MGNPIDIRDHWLQTVFILMLAPLFVAQFGNFQLGGGDRRNAEANGSSVNHVEAQEVPTEREPVGPVQMKSENARRDA
jgi:hypothetical protein